MNRLGKAVWGLKPFESIVSHPGLRELPMYLETPNELEGYQKEIELLKKCMIHDAVK